MQSAQTAKAINGLQNFSDLAVMTMLRDASQYLADTQRRVQLLQAEIDRRITAGGTQLKNELATVMAQPTPPRTAAANSIPLGKK
jgi:hypothetical protein